MRILMFGRGVISTIYGRVLHAAGHDVEFYVRPGRAAEYGDEVRLDWIDGRRKPFGRRVRESFRTPLRESIDPGDGFDLIVLSVGHHRLAEAAAFLAPRLGAATVLVFGNLWEEPLTAVAPLPADRLVFGFPQAGGGFMEDGVLWGAMLPSVVIGTTPPRRGVSGRCSPPFGKRASPFGKRKTCEGGCGSTSSPTPACSTRGCGAGRWRT